MDDVQTHPQYGKSVELQLFVIVCATYYFDDPASTTICFDLIYRGRIGIRTHDRPKTVYSPICYFYCIAFAIR